MQATIKKSLFDYIKDPLTHPNENWDILLGKTIIWKYNYRDSINENIITDYLNKACLFKLDTDRWLSYKDITILCVIENPVIKISLPIVEKEYVCVPYIPYVSPTTIPNIEYPNYPTTTHPDYKIWCEYVPNSH